MSRRRSLLMDEVENPLKGCLSGGLHGWVFVGIVVYQGFGGGLARAHRGADAAPLAKLDVAQLAVLDGAAVAGVYRGADSTSIAMFVLVVAKLFVEHFFRFAQSRAVESADACVVENWANTIAPGGGRVEDLIFAYVAHNTFAQRKDDR